MTPHNVEVDWPRAFGCIHPPRAALALALREPSAVWVRAPGPVCLADAPHHERFIVRTLEGPAILAYNPIASAWQLT